MNADIYLRPVTDDGIVVLRDPSTPDVAASGRRAAGWGRRPEPPALPFLDDEDVLMLVIG